MKRTCVVILCVVVLALTISFDPQTNKVTHAQASGPSMLVRNLEVRQVIGDLVTPIAMAFIARNDFLVLEKNTGKVQRVKNGAVKAYRRQPTIHFFPLRPNAPTRLSSELIPITFSQCHYSAIASIGLFGTARHLHSITT